MRDVRILKIESDASVSFSITSQRNILSEGPSSLIQVIVSFLLTTPGTDSFYRTRGGGLGDLCRRIRMDPELLESEIATRVRVCEKQILDDQIYLTELPLDETLLHMSLHSIEVDPLDPGSVNISINVETRAGEAYTFSI